jgi:hypothetical protein
MLHKDFLPKWKGGKTIMAQTENGEKVFEYYCNCETLEFASDWMEFFMFHKMGNKMWDWHKWCDEFAEWAILNSEYDIYPTAEKFNLITEMENA